MNVFRGVKIKVLTEKELLEYQGKGNSVELKSVEIPEPQEEPTKLQEEPAVETPEPQEEPVAVETPEPQEEPVAVETPEPQEEPVKLQEEPVAVEVPEPQEEPVKNNSSSFKKKTRKK